MTGADVKAFRQRMGWPQERLAYELGKCLSTIARWEQEPHNELPKGRIVELALQQLGIIYAETIPHNSETITEGPKAAE